MDNFSGNMHFALVTVVTVVTTKLKSMFGTGDKSSYSGDKPLYNNNEW